jgi:tetratricopeptide (TPR) repeat protein
MTVSTLKELGDIGRSAWDNADYALLESTGRELISRGENEGDAAGRALGYRYLGVARIAASDETGAKAALYTALQMFSELGDTVNAANVMLSLATVAVELRLDVTEAHGLSEEALGMLRAAGASDRVAVALGNLGEVYRQEGDYRRALAAATEALEIFQEVGDHARAGWQLTNIAHLHVLRRDDEKARDFLQRAYDELCIAKNPRWFTIYFDVWFMFATRLERWETAAQIQGFLEKYRDENRVPRLLGLFPWYAPSVERLHEHLPNARYDELNERGAELSLEEAYALTANVR